MIPTLGITCTPPDSNADMDIVSGTEVVLRCTETSTFTDGSSMKLLLCNSTGSWSDDDVMCQGK